MKSSGSAPKGECPTCSKLLAKSNVAKHPKVCDKTKPRKTRKAINRESYTRHKAKILKKRQENRTYDQFRRLELAQEQLTGLASKPLEVNPVEDPSWEPLVTTNLLHSELKQRCKKRHGLGPKTIEAEHLYKSAMFVLHADKLASVKRQLEMKRLPIAGLRRQHL